MMNINPRSIDSTVSSVLGPDLDPDDGEETMLYDEVTQNRQPNKITGKQICRSETPSEADRVEQYANKEDAKRTLT